MSEQKLTEQGEEKNLSSVLESAKGYIQAKKKKFPIGWFIVVLLLIIALLICILMLKSSHSEDPTLVVKPDPTVIVVDDDITVTVESVRNVISHASELVSCKYYYTNADTFENSKKWFGEHKVPFTKEQTVFIYTGVISAGVRLDEIDDNSIVVDNSSKIITIILPELKVLSHEIDEDNFHAYEIKKSIFTEMSLQNYADMMASLKEKEEYDLKSNTEFWEQTKTSVQNTLSALLLTADTTKSYTVVFK